MKKEIKKIAKKKEALNFFDGVPTIKRAEQVAGHLNLGKKKRKA